MSPHPNQPQSDDPDDFFAHTRMSLGDHIEELRIALWKAIKWFGIMMIGGFFLAQYALDFIAKPIAQQMAILHNNRVKETEKNLRKEEQSPGGGELKNLNDPRPIQLLFPKGDTGKVFGFQVPADEADIMVPITVYLKPLEWVMVTSSASNELNQTNVLSTLSATEAFMIWMKVGMYCGFVLASPMIFYQIWMFIGAGLYPQEKKLVHVYLPFSITLFLAGVALCEFIVLPIGIHYLLSFNEWLGFRPDLRLSEWLSFAIMMPVIFGVCFQLPLVMFFLCRLGIVSVETYISKWRMVIFILLVASGLLSVSPDPFSMMAMAIPMWILYLLGIALCKYMPQDKPDIEVPDPEDMVEV